MKLTKNYLKRLIKEVINEGKKDNDFEIMDTIDFYTSRGGADDISNKELARLVAQKLKKEKHINVSEKTVLDYINDMK